MCGIVGYCGARTAAPILYRGLQRLEYRGYDSAGVAVATDDGFRVARAKGHVSGLSAKLPPEGNWGLGHTRWATHGKPSEHNAHPIASCDGRVVVVHNGIIENHDRLRRELSGRGHRFATETDTEVVAHLLEEEVRRAKLAEALLATVERLEGSYALVAASAREPGTLACARIASPLVLGLGEGENFVASDVAAFLDSTRRVAYLGEGELATVTRDSVRVFDRKGRPVSPAVETVAWSLADAEKGGFEHFMLKEIHETPRAIADALLGRASLLAEGRLAADAGQLLDWYEYDRLLMVACGTSYHAGLVGRRFFETIAKLPVDVELASEFRLRPDIPVPRWGAIAITQSGETADTLAAMKKARTEGYRILTLANVVGSTATRLSEGTFLTRAGPEVSVAATKSFTNQIVSLALLAVHAGHARGRLGPSEVRRLSSELAALPRFVQSVIDAAPGIRDHASLVAQAQSCFFIGRGSCHAIALEGALKLKEISYVHAEGFAAGELKHGPLALLDERTPVVALVPPDATRSLVLANVGEIRARDAPVLVVCEEGDREAADAGDRVLTVPAADPAVFPVTANVALQLLAYHAARALSRPIDRPRNLAKSVTVE